MYPDEKFKQIQSLISPTVCNTHRIAMCSCTACTLSLLLRYTRIMLNPLIWNHGELIY